MAEHANSPAPGKSRLIGLDLLRFIAIILVLGHHMWPAPEDWPILSRSILDTWQRGGWIGVDLFFVLSGYLVSGLLFTEFKTHGRIRFRRFFVRRGWKIYPPFLVLIAFTVLVYRGYIGKLYPTWNILSELLFIQSYIPGIWMHTWSLSVEEHFYILLPLTLIVLLKLNRASTTPLRPILGLTLTIGIACLLMRFINWQVRDTYSHYTHYFPSVLRIDSLMFGVVISYGHHFHTEWFVRVFAPTRRWLIIFGGLLLLPAFVWPRETTPWIYIMGFTLFYSGAGMILMGTMLYNVPRNRITALLAGLGAYSYSIYLWHGLVIAWAVPIMENEWDVKPGHTIRLILYLFGSLAVGIVMAKLVETPSLWIRDRWFPSRTQGAVYDLRKTAK